MTTLLRRLRQWSMSRLNTLSIVGGKPNTYSYRYENLHRSASNWKQISPVHRRLLNTVSNSNIAMEMEPKPSYDECVRRLYLTNMFHPMKVGLQNIVAIHEALGSPMNKVSILAS